MTRDHFGIKPFFYTLVDDEIIFSSEIKGVLANPKVNVKIDKVGIAELFGLRSMPYTWEWYF